jgi:4-amino-4-deoxy-L-arabinose transferase-like glycosyltransferase
MRRNTEAFQEGSSEVGQRLNPYASSVVQPIIELFWGRQKNYLYPTYIDITPYLGMGKNTICLDVTTAETHPSLLVDGVVDLKSGNSIALHTDAGWKVSPTGVWGPDISWFETGFDDIKWANADDLEKPPVAKDMWLVVDSGVFETPFNGCWFISAADQMLFTGNAFFREPPDRCRLEILSAMDYLLSVNGHLVSPVTGSNLSNKDKIDILDIGPLLNKGENRLQIALKGHSNEASPGSQKLAVGGWVSDGKTQKPVNAFFQWSSRTFAENAVHSDIHSFVTLQPLSTVTRAKYRRVYCGEHLSLRQHLTRAFGWSIMAFLMTGILTALCFRTGRLENPRLLLVKSGLLFFFALDIMLFFAAAQETMMLRLFKDGILWQCAFILMLVFLLLLVFFERSIPSALSFWKKKFPFDAAVKNASIISILVLGFILRVWNVWEQNLNADEASSISVSLQILEHGFPFLYSGIIYVRSTLFHYLEALNILVFGNNLLGMRALSIITGVCTIYLVYRFVDEVFKNRTAAIIAALLICVSPWEIIHSRIGRYYQMAQFLILLSVYFLYKGAVLKKDIRFQWAMIFTYMFSVISSEITATFLPALFSAYFLQWEKWRWKEHAHVFVGVFSLVFMMVFILIARTTATRTFPIMLPIMTEPVSPHIPPAFSFPVFILFGYSYFNFLICSFAVAAVFYWFYRGSKAILTLYWLIFASLISIMSLIMPETARYVFYLNPLFAMIAAVSLCEIPAMVHRFLESRSSALLQLIAAFAVVFHLSLILTLYQPWRIAEVLKTGRINREEVKAVKFIRDHMRSEDMIITTHVQTAAVALQRSPDYVLLPYFTFGTVFLRPEDGKMADRWNASEVLTNIDKLRMVMDTHDRVWFLMSDMPGIVPAEMKTFLDKTTREVYNVFCAKVLLWDSEWGRLGSYRRRQMEGNLF